MAFLTQIASFLMNNSFLAGLFYNPTDENSPWNPKNANHIAFLAKYGWLEQILQFIDDAFIPIMIVVAAVGGIWCIFLGVNLARAESADKAQEAKKRLINVVIAIIASALLIFLLSLFVSQIPTIFK